MKFSDSYTLRRSSPPKRKGTNPVHHQTHNTKMDSQIHHAEDIQAVDCQIQGFAADTKTTLGIIKYLSKVLNHISQSKNAMISPSLLKQRDIHTRRVSPEETRIKWRRDQIRTQMKLGLEANSSWCNKHLPQVIWCGYLRKGAATPWKQPTERWTEVRSEPAPQASAISRIVVMQYRSSGQTTKRLTVSDPRREAARDIAGKAYLSVAVEGRRGRVLLSLKSGHDADTLVRCILAELRPAFSFLP